MELDGKAIDVVWNGMTLTDEVLSAMECSNAYCNNAQVVILPADAAADYPDAASMAGLQFAVETGSAGEDMAIENGFAYTPVADQATAVLEVSSGTCHAAIIDSLMAAAMVGEGTSYADLTYTIQPQQRGVRRRLPQGQRPRRRAQRVLRGGLCRRQHAGARRDLRRLRRPHPAGVRRARPDGRLTAPEIKTKAKQRTRRALCFPREQARRDLSPNV